MERDFKGVWIPKEIWLSKELKALEKMFFIEIDSLDCKQRCFASNAHFSDLFGITKQRCSQIIASLEEKIYIKTTLIREGKQVKKRIIKVSRKFDRGIKKTGQGYQENAKGTNTKEQYKETICAFDAFWNKWPKKKDKQKAQSAFNKLTNIDRQLAIDGVDNFVKGKEIKYITIPTTYLNNKRWEDEHYDEDFRHKQTSDEKIRESINYAENHLRQVQGYNI